MMTLTDSLDMETETVTPTALAMDLAVVPLAVVPLEAVPLEAVAPLEEEVIEWQTSALA
jgi:hypothetical protein